MWDSDLVRMTQGIFFPHTAAASSLLVFFFLFVCFVFINLFIYLLIFGCAGSSLLRVGFL